MSNRHEYNGNGHGPLDSEYFAEDPKESSGIDLIAEERSRQKIKYTNEQDDRQTKSELAWLASCLSAEQTIYVLRQFADGQFNFVPAWPYRFPKQRHDRIGALVRAGALICAEIDRLQRAKKSAS